MKYQVKPQTMFAAQSWETWMPMRTSIRLGKFQTVYQNFSQRRVIAAQTIVE
jgi:hypothetical protein